MKEPQVEAPEFTDEDLLAALKRVGARAREEAFGAGKPIVFLRGSQLVWLYPDGHEECAEVASQGPSTEQSP